eukprot:TRINITY_DN6842_c0_g1_i1.p1 TRINITY_DN6842_c0_g1~~TRINITY_DN6842_c0_g1_i1.p1  ORF type:complete len:721 (+),score=143.86 TRINITY_DN6842_c0_g1_i1:79-2163(+)
MSPGSVAVVGGGVSGLVCAIRLRELGFTVELYDTGRRGVGGRMATRGAAAGRFDSAAQLFSASHPFRALCSEWESKGWLRRAAPRVARVGPGLREDISPPAGAAVYNADGGMEMLCRRLGDALRAAGGGVRTQMWATRVERTADQRWAVEWDLWSLGAADWLVIAHNGKCANRIAAAPGLEHCLRLLRQLRLLPVWAVALRFPCGLGLPFEAFSVAGPSSLSWAQCQSAKFGAEGEEGESWVLLSTADYGWSNKVPQEAVPPELRRKVAAEMSAAFAAAVGPHLPSKLPAAVGEPFVQLWGAGVAANTLDGAPCVLDVAARAGVCGDWCLSPCVEGAALSGLALADRIAAAPAGPTLLPAGGGGVAAHPTALEFAAFPGWLDPATTLPTTAEEAPGAPQHSSREPRPAAAGRRARARGGRLQGAEWGRGQRPTARTPQQPQQQQLKKHSDPSSGATDEWAAAAPRVVTAPRLASARRAPPAAARELQPGLVVRPGALDAAAQQAVADLALRLGQGLPATPDCDALPGGGFFRVTADGRRELNMQRGTRGSLVLRAGDLPAALSQLCAEQFEAAAAVSHCLPAMDAACVVINFYSPECAGLEWHRDGDEVPDAIRGGTGRPVLSVSVGDDCDFGWKPRSAADAARTLRLRSGDVLVFGGPSRGIPHAVTAIHGGTRPVELRMPPGRLNLTFRHHA